MLPESEREMAGATAGWSDFLAMARAIEDLGFDSLWFADHLLMTVEGHEPQGAWEAWSMLSAFAAVTDRIELAPFVSCTAYRNPALTAKIAETVDEICGGRLILGLGSGWAEPEYAAFGFPFDHRFSRFEEAFTIIRKLIREGEVDFHGKWYDVDHCLQRPRGPRPDGMPIMVGTFGAPKMTRLIAEHADIWNVWAQHTGNRAAGVEATAGEAGCRLRGGGARSGDAGADGGGDGRLRRSLWTTGPGSAVTDGNARGVGGRDDGLRRPWYFHRSNLSRSLHGRRDRSAGADARNPRPSLRYLMSTHLDKAERFRALHVPGDPLILVNVWDVASARVVASNPATKAIATASWSVAAAMGHADGEQTPLDDVLRLARRIVDVTDLPVSVDFEKGYADDLDVLEDNVRRLCQTGVVGLNIEDSIGPDDGPCRSTGEAARRIERVRQAATAEGVQIVINARTDILAGGGRVSEAIERGNAYLRSGADCIFVLGGIGPNLLTLINQITGPVSVLAGAGSPSVGELAELGVARISVGPGAMGVAYAALASLAAHVNSTGEWPSTLAFRPGA